jgi:hypothetical protein
VEFAGWLRNFVRVSCGGGGTGDSWSVHWKKCVYEYECCGEGIMVWNGKLGSWAVDGWFWVDIGKYWDRRILGMGFLVDSLLGAYNKIG